MASKKQKTKKKTHNDEYSGGGVFSINKARTSVFTKVVLVVLAVVLAVGTSAGIMGVFFGSPDAGADDLITINATYQRNVDALKDQAKANPKDASLQVKLGDTYFDWARKLEETWNNALQKPESLASFDATTTAVQVASAWQNASAAYAKAIEIDPNQTPNVKTDYTMALLSSSETTKAIEMATSVIQESPRFAMAHMALADAYRASGQNGKAIEEYNKYIELDPDNSNNISYAKQQLEALKGDAATNKVEEVEKTKKTQ